MGVNVSAYVERKNEDGSWKLVTASPVSSNLKHILKDYNEYGRLQWEDLSDGLKEKFKKDESGNCYCSFHLVTVSELEGEISGSIKQTFTRVNTIVEALGCPINKRLVEELQYALDTMRDIGRREAFDLFVDEHMEWGKEYRVVLVVC